MREEYKKQASAHGANSLSDIVSKQLAFVSKESTVYDDSSAQEKYGSKVLETSPERTIQAQKARAKNSPKGKAMPVANNGAMFTAMRKATLKRRPL